MERRGQIRHLRRLQVQFTERGTDKRHMGYTANVSTSGMYIYTSHLSAKGTRLRLKLIGEDRSNVVLEAMVMRVNRSMHTLRTSGVGVRFLPVEELVGELFPEIGASVELPVSRPTAVGEISSGDAYRLEFADRRRFIEAYKRDLSTGGLFVPTDNPAPLNEVVVVEVSIDEPGTAPVRFEARVVHRVEPGMPLGSGSGNLMAGMGLELLNFDQTLLALQGLAEYLQRTA